MQAWKPCEEVEKKILPAKQFTHNNYLPGLHWFENKTAATDQLANMHFFMFGIIPNTSCIIKSN